MSGKIELDIDEQRNGRTNEQMNRGKNRLRNEKKRGTEKRKGKETDGDDKETVTMDGVDVGWAIEDDRGRRCREENDVGCKKTRSE